MSDRDAPRPTELSAAKRALLARWARGEGTTAPPDAAPAPAALERAPLSFTQGRVWFFERLEPGTCRYNMPFALRASGPLDVAALGRAFDALVARHDALRARIEIVDGEPFQRIDPPRDGTLVEVTLPPAGSAPADALQPLAGSTLDVIALPTDATRDDLDQAAARFAEAEARRPFDLAAGPLHRFRLLRLAEREFALITIVHHLVFDGWSLGVALRELGELYEAAISGRPSRLPPLPLQYPAFAARQRKRWSEGAYREDLTYWRDRLLGAPLSHALPTDRPRPPAQTAAGAIRSRRLDPATVNAADAFARREGLSPFVPLFAAFAALVHQLSGEPDVVVGSSVAQRTEPGTEALIGAFVNTIVLRTDLSGDPTFRELLTRVHDAERGALRHQELPFDRLVEALGVPRDPAYAPLVQIEFVLQNFPMPPLEFGGVPLRPLPVDQGAAKFDLTLYLDRLDAENALNARVEYNTDLFDASTVDSLLSAYETLLGAASASPGSRLSSLPLLRPSERRTLLALGEGPPLPPAALDTLTALLERQAAKTPERVALAFRGESITYANLDRRASALARCLRARGVTTASRVALCLERTPDLVVAIVAVLKAGGAYLPLDLAWPSERVAYVLDDARAALIVTHSALLTRLGPHAEGALCLDLAESEPAAASPDAPEVASTSPDAPSTASASLDMPGPRPRDPAYVLYTSGSTGRPKGVVIEHAGAAALVATICRAFSEDDLAVTAFMTSAAFDMSVPELFPPLAVGGTVVILPNALALGELGDKVTFAVGVPTVMAELARARALPASLRAVLLGGELLSGDLVSALGAARPGLRVYNGWGPTEISVYATIALATEGDPAPHIGFPIEARRVYVLDPHLQPTPTNLPGELYVGGPVGVAHGYVGRPALTADRFLPDPFALEPGARMYKTGDFARLRADGSISFVGRRDHQIKIRGHRVELAEIESALSEHPGVSECAVLTVLSPAADTTLAAYVVGRTDPPPPADELRAFLAKRLPGYMLPSHFVSLEHLPRTVGGKLNRRALPPATPTPAGPTASPPRDALEYRLAQLWQEALGPRPIDVRADFFELGGHSLLALRLATRLEAEFAHPTPLALLFQNPTIERLAEALRRRPEGATRPASPLLRLGAGEAPRRPFFFVHGAGGSALPYAELARRLNPTRPFYALHAPGLESDAPPAPTLEALCRHYVDALRDVQPHGPYALGGWSFGATAAFEMARQLELAGEFVTTLIFVDGFAPDLLASAFADEASRLAAFTDALAPGRPPLDQHSLGSATPAETLGGVHTRETLGSTAHAALGGTTTRDALGRLLERLTPPGASPPLSLDRAERYYRVLCHHLDLASRYVPHRRVGTALLLRCPLPPGAEGHNDLGWGAWLSSPPDVRELPGDHHALLRPPHVDELARALDHALDACDPP